MGLAGLLARAPRLAWPRRGHGVLGHDDALVALVRRVGLGVLCRVDLPTCAAAMAERPDRRQQDRRRVVQVAKKGGAGPIRHAQARSLPAAQVPQVTSCTYAPASARPAAPRRRTTARAYVSVCPSVYYKPVQRLVEKQRTHTHTAPSRGRGPLFESPFSSANKRRPLPSLCK